MRILYASINSELSWQPASSCQTSPLRASGMPFFASCWTCLGLCDRFWCHLTRTSCHASRRLSSVTSLLTTPDPLNRGSSPSEKWKSHLWIAVIWTTLGIIRGMLHWILFVKPVCFPLKKSICRPNKHFCLPFNQQNQFAYVFWSLHVTHPLSLV